MRLFVYDKQKRFIAGYMAISLFCLLRVCRYQMQNQLWRKSYGKDRY